MRNNFATITNISYEETGYHRTMITTHAAPNKKYGSCLKNVKHNRRGRPPIDPRIVDFMKKDRLEGSTIQHIAWKYNVSVSTAAKYLKGVPQAWENHQ
jgi:hypothetical protein